MNSLYAIVVKSQKTLLENFQYLLSNSSAKLIIRFKSDTKVFERMSEIDEESGII